VKDNGLTSISLFDTLSLDDGFRGTPASKLAAIPFIAATGGFGSLLNSAGAPGWLQNRLILTAGKN
jgi:hypothetical protein